jgi:glycosyltransferase involved in cell wall biosynthesis
MKIKFSIVTITFNSEGTLRDTIESVLIQKYRPLQYIIQDGGSMDTTLCIAESYKDKFERENIELIIASEKDKGISDAFNKGISKADGDIIGIINSDDKLFDSAIESIVKEYKKNIDVYYGDCVIFNDKNTSEYIATPGFLNNPDLLNKGMALFHPSCFISRKTYEQYGVYNIDIKLCMDRDLLLRIYRNGGEFLYIHKPLAYYREGGANQKNYEKCALENMEISISYGMNPIEAKIRKIYFKAHDSIWKLIQELGLERIFHKQL